MMVYVLSFFSAKTGENKIRIKRKDHVTKRVLAIAWGLNDVG